MSEMQPVSEADVPTAVKPIDPRRNPAYPARIHWGEKEHWLGILETCEQRIAAPRQKLSTLDNHPNRDFYSLLYSRMLGARDQIADAVRRLPGETGDLYEEDRHRVEGAVKSLDRLLARWEQGS